jgi:hypothetical protein
MTVILLGRQDADVHSWGKRPVRFWGRLRTIAIHSGGGWGLERLPTGLWNGRSRESWPGNADQPPSRLCLAFGRLSQVGDLYGSSTPSAAINRNRRFLSWRPFATIPVGTDLTLYLQPSAPHRRRGESAL